MLDRFDLRPLFRGLDAGLRRRQQFGSEPPDVGARRVLLWVPVLAVLGCIYLRAIISQPGQFTAAFSLLASALLSAFALVARWRETLSNRERKIDAVPKKALDETVAHILICCLLGVAAAGLTAVLGMFTVPTPWSPMRWFAVVVSALVVGVGTRLVLHFVIVVHLLWEGYERVNPAAETREYPSVEQRRDAS